MTKTKDLSIARILGSCARLSLALAIAAPAIAQSGPAADAPAEPAQEIVVTGSQISRAGFVSPTPVTSVNMADIQRVASSNIADALNQLPALKPSVTPSSVSNLSKLAGGNYLDLRGLGYLRTLTLIDGKRYMPGTPEGAININNIPQALIGGVDVVTGGASAAYGSDAVAGVVNFKIDNKFTGLRGSIQGGISDHNDHKNYLGSLAWGTNWGPDERGHFVIGAEIAKNTGIADATRRKWAGNRGLIDNPNPAGPALIHVNDANASYASQGGLITTGIFAGQKFNPGGTLSPFVRGANYIPDDTMDGGDGDHLASPYVLEAPTKRWSTYAAANYKIGDSMTAYASFSYAHSSLDERSIPSDDTFTIQSDNAFLPAAMRTALAAAGQTSFQLGRGSEDYGVGRIVQHAYTLQATAGLKGSLGGSWTFDGSYSWGQSRTNTLFTGDVIKANRTNAIDAVFNGAGQIVCRSTLTNPGNGCVPINLFGVGSPSQAAIDYITGISQRDWRQQQQVADLTLRGNLFSTWAGPVSFAVGGEWRRFDVNVGSDPISAAPNVTLYRVGNVKPYKAFEDVKEGFAEVVVPLAKDEAWAKNIDLDLAGRVTHYKNSGTVETWKAGLNYAINDTIRLRGTRSRDIRAPNINELFAAGQTLINTVNDSKTGAIYSVSQTTGGNPFLKPEKADTLTAGLVLTPRAIRGLNLSVDYYDIKVTGAIASLTLQTIVNRCNSGDASTCPLITRDAGTGRITGVLLAPVNFQTLRTRGVDVEISYRMPAMGGTVELHGLVNYLAKLDLSGNGTTTKFAGNTDQPVLDGPGGTPHWKGSASAVYGNDRFKLGVTGRYVGGGVITNDAVTLDYNHVSGRFYLDFSGEYTLVRTANGGKIALFGSILNALDRDPPFTGYQFQTARQLYDVIGRQYTGGVRFNF